MEIISIILILVAVVAVTGVLFGVWAVSAIVRGVARTILPKRLPRVVEQGRQGCANTACLCTNPAHARFCRRCGRPLPALMRLAGSRAA